TQSCLGNGSTVGTPSADRSRNEGSHRASLAGITGDRSSITCTGGMIDGPQSASDSARAQFLQTMHIDRVNTPAHIVTEIENVLWEFKDSVTVQGKSPGVTHTVRHRSTPEIILQLTNHFGVHLLRTRKSFVKKRRKCCRMGSSHPLNLPGHHQSCWLTRKM